MANRRLYQFRYSYERDLVDVYLKMSFGAAGAPTLLPSKGISFVTRISAGKYQINLMDNFNKLMFAQDTFQIAAGPAAPIMYIVSDNSSLNVGPNIVVQFTNSTNVATDPASGEVVFMEICLRNAST